MLDFIKLDSIKVDSVMERAGKRRDAMGDPHAAT
jgi:hypothetical protein